MLNARVKDVIEHAGLGICGEVNGHQVAIGSAAFVADATGHSVADVAGAIWISIDRGVPRPCRLAAATRTGVDSAVTALARRFETWLLSGDHPPRLASPWRSLFGDRLKFRQSPEEKLTAVASLERSGHRVLMLGDGLNDMQTQLGEMQAQLDSLRLVVARQDTILRQLANLAGVQAP